MHIAISRQIKIKFLLVLILFLATFARLYQVSEVPPSVSWDEAAIGYDAYLLGIDGKDQWGDTLPLVFKSFGEYKYPLHIYTTALFVKIFGLSDLVVRLPSALLGVVNILLLFFLTRHLIKNTVISLLASLFLAISPWHIQFSRMNWETNFALFFFFAANLIFLKSMNGQEKWNNLLLILSYLFFGATIYTYNAAKVFIPIYVLLLTIIYFRRLVKTKSALIISVIIFAVIIMLNLLNPKLSGLIRFQQVNFPDEWITSTYIYNLTGNRILSRLEIITKQYFNHFSPQFLFISGDANPRHSSQYIGQIYLFDGVFILFGLLLLIKRRKIEDLVLLSWFFLALLPSSIAKESPHASRAMFALGSWQIISAIGAISLFSLIKNQLTKKLLMGFSLAAILISFAGYFSQYLNNYPIKYSQDFQYGYKKIFTDYKKEFDKYNKVIVSDEYGQPYIFALYYLKYDPQKFRREFSGFSKFDKLEFGKISDLLPNGTKNSLVFASKKEFIEDRMPKDMVKFLDGSVAFWVYEIN